MRGNTDQQLDRQTGKHEVAYDRRKRDSSCLEEEETPLFELSGEVK
jgi:hypothetical protein